MNIVCKGWVRFEDKSQNSFDTVYSYIAFHCITGIKWVNLRVTTGSNENCMLFK